MTVNIAGNGLNFKALHSCAKMLVGHAIGICPIHQPDSN